MSARSITLLGGAALAAWSAGCSDEGTAPAPTASVGRLHGPPQLDARPGDRPDGRLRGVLRVDFDERVPAGSWLRIDQGYVEDGHELFGETIRYRLPDLISAGREIPEVTARLTGSHSRPVLVQALPPAVGWFRASIERGAPAGTSLQIELGSGAPDTGPRTPTIPLDVELHAFLDSGAERRRLDGSIPVRVVDPTVDWLRILGPPQAAPGEPVRWTVCFMNGLSGPRSSSMVAPPPAENALEWWDGEAWRPLSPLAVPPPDRSAGIDVETPSLPAGVHRLRLRARSADRVWQGLSSPIEIGAESPRFFGALHNHTSVGGHGGSTPRRTLRYARDVARLDFCGLTEHAESPLLDWEWLASLEGEETRPGQFLVFLGFEWTHSLEGHRHVVFRTAEGHRPLAATARPPPAPGVGVAGDLAALREQVGQDPDALVVVHHPLWFGGVAQQAYRYGEPGWIPRQRLAEVYSWHGSSLGGDTAFPIHGTAAHRMPGGAAGIRDALMAGHPFQLVADGDNHLGRPGSLVGVRWNQAIRYAYQGVMAVRASSLDRDEVFDALSTGPVYGTTGSRLLLDLERDEDGALDVRVHATAPLRSFEVLGPAGSVARLDFDAVPPSLGDREAGLDLDPEQGVWDLDRRFEQTRGEKGPLFVVLVQQDQHRAWQSVPGID